MEERGATVAPHLRGPSAGQRRLIQSALLARCWDRRAAAGPLFVLGSLEFVGPFEPGGWTPTGTPVPLAYIGWSVWLLALGVGLLVTA